MSEAGFAPGRPGDEQRQIAEAARAEIFGRAARAVRRIDAHGLRGITGLSVLDIEAMAVALAMLGIFTRAPDAPDNTGERDDD